MKITNSDLIRSRERDLLEMISGDLDRNSIKELLVDKYRLDLDGDSLACRGGDLVVHENQVAYKIEYDAAVILSLLFNRQGECVDASLSTPADAPDDKAAEILESGTDAGAVAEEAADQADGIEENDVQEADPREDSPSARMASTIADMISEINKP